MTVTIRDIKESDKAQWTELWNKYLKFYASTGVNSSVVTEQVTETTFSRFLDPTESLGSIVAEDDETHELVGFASYTFIQTTMSMDDLMRLNDLFVDETRRLAGIGRKLVERVYEICDEKKAGSVVWLTQENNNISQLLFSNVAERDGLIDYQRPVKITN